MFRNIRLVAFAVVVAIVTGCSSDGLTGPAQYTLPDDSVVDGCAIDDVQQDCASRLVQRGG